MNDKCVTYNYLIMKKRIVLLVFVLSSMIVFSCQNNSTANRQEVANEDLEILNKADSSILSTMDVEGKIRTIQAYKIAEYIDLNLTDSVYTLSISKEDAKKIGVSEKIYDEVVENINQINEAIAAFNHSHSPNDTFELTDFKKLIKK